jgi:EAL domain-containing protein (putative c-di-GMP-specific phosphodiesterase class I)
MDLQTVAEYVGSEKTRELITKLGVDYAQGHFIGRPVPIEAVLADHPELLESTSG